MKTLTDIIDSVIDYIAHGRVEGMIIFASDADRDMALSVQQSVIADGTSCRIISAESITVDEEVIDICKGKMAMTTEYSGHLFVRPHLTTAIAMHA